MSKSMIQQINELEAMASISVLSPTTVAKLSKITKERSEGAVCNLVDLIRAGKLPELTKAASNLLEIHSDSKLLMMGVSDLLPCHLNPKSIALIDESGEVQYWLNYFEVDNKGYFITSRGLFSNELDAMKSHSHTNLTVVKFEMHGEGVTDSAYTQLHNEAMSDVVDDIEGFIEEKHPNIDLGDAFEYVELKSIVAGLALISITANYEHEIDMAQTLKLVAAQLAFQALKPIVSNSDLHGTDQACDAENEAFELAKKAGVEFDEMELLGCTDEDRMKLMLERIEAKIK